MGPRRADVEGHLRPRRVIRVPRWRLDGAHARRDFVRRERRRPLDGIARLCLGNVLAHLQPGFSSSLGKWRLAGAVRQPQGGERLHESRPIGSVAPVPEKFVMVCAQPAIERGPSGSAANGSERRAERFDLPDGFFDSRHQLFPAPGKGLN